MKTNPLPSLRLPGFLLLAAASAASPAAGQTPTPARPAVRALHTAEPITLDGRLDEPVWQKVPAYALALPQSNETPGGIPAENARVRFAWDDRWFYAAFELEDRDVVQESDRDQQHHYDTGDVLELFLKPAAQPWYWEFYVTPNAKKTAFFYPSRSYKGLPGPFDYRSGLAVAAQLDGTLNHWRDDDRGWTAEIAVPRAELAGAGVPLDPANAWTLLTGRYNYGRHLPDRELSSLPRLSRLNFHRHEEWAAVELAGNDPAVDALYQLRPPAAIDPSLPDVLLLGDSISIGYEPQVSAVLRGRANVYRIRGTEADTVRPAGGLRLDTIAALEHLDAWLAGRKWAVIHFNWGLHDIKRGPSGVRQVEPGQYERNVRQLAGRLKQTGARLIWAGSTPVPAGASRRTPGDEVPYNETAARVMAELAIPVDDLPAAVRPQLAVLQRAHDVHFTAEGCRRLGDHVAAAISPLLPPVRSP